MIRLVLRLQNDIINDILLKNLSMPVRLCPLMIFKQVKCPNGEATPFHYVSDLLTPTNASNAVQKSPLCEAITACLTPTTADS